MTEKKHHSTKKEQRLKKAQKVRTKQEKAAERKKMMPLIKAFGLWIVLVLIVNIPSFKDFFAKFFLDFTMKSVLFLSKIMFLPVEHINEYLIRVNDFNLQIIFECTAYNFYLFVIPLVIFSNWTVRQKSINIFIFLGVIIVANFFRFIIMGYIGGWFPNAFESIHDYVWNIIFGVLVFGVWLWREKISQLKLQKTKND